MGLESSSLSATYLIAAVLMPKVIKKYKKEPIDDTKTYFPYSSGPNILPYKTSKAKTNRAASQYPNRA